MENIRVISFHDKREAQIIADTYAKASKALGVLDVYDLAPKKLFPQPGGHGRRRLDCGGRSGGL